MIDWLLDKLKFEVFSISESEGIVVTYFLGDSYSSYYKVEIDQNELLVEIAISQIQQKLAADIALEIIAKIQEDIDKDEQLVDKH